MSSTEPSTNNADVRRHVFRWTSAQVRLIAAGFVGLTAVAISFPMESELRSLLTYDLAIATYLALLGVRIANADGQSTRDLAEREEPSNRVVLTLAGILSGCSLLGVGLMLHRSKNWTPLMSNLHLALSLLAIFLSWALLHITFGVHYARIYYDPTPPPGEHPSRPPLEFPTDELPEFLDFMYFAFTLAVCYQVSDITICSRQLRRVALAHMLLSFLNVTIILGLVVEIVSTLARPVGPSL